MVSNLKSETDDERSVKMKSVRRRWLAAMKKKMMKKSRKMMKRVRPNPTRCATSKASPTRVVELICYDDSLIMMMKEEEMKKKKRVNYERGW